MRQLCMVVVLLQMTIVLGSAIRNETTQSEEPDAPTDCFHQPAEKCGTGTECVDIEEGNTTGVLCCNLSPFRFKEQTAYLMSQKKNLRRLHFRNITLNTSLNMSLFWTSNLESLAITDSPTIKVVGANTLGPLTNLKCLNLSNNHLTEVDSQLVDNLPMLTQLDLSKNNLTNFSMGLPGKDNNSSDLDFWLDISNNSKIWCSNINEIRSRFRDKWNLYFLNQNDITCLQLKSEAWFKYLETRTFQELLVSEQVKEDCQKHTPCSCELVRLFYTSQAEPYFSFSVNCAGRNITSLPRVPQHTYVLNVSNNNISSLKRIRTDPNYRYLSILYADNNQIVSLQDLEGSNFLKKFQLLDLRSNKIREIETYIYNQAFESDNNRKVKLGGNKVICSCSTAQHVKMWLLKNKEHILDRSDIMCENFNDKVMELDQNKVCTYPRVWTDYINYIIAGEVVLLFLLISKVSYDYWVFRTAGYLPWPASKMPKMPCDWVFET